MEFGVLGPLRLAHAGDEIPIGGLRRQSLLATLLLQSNQRVTTTSLATALYGDSPPLSATSNLRTYISELRQLLGPLTTAGCLISHQGGYSIDLVSGQLDLLQFRSLLREGELAREEGDPERAGDVLEQCLNLWRGQPLEGLNMGLHHEATLSFMREEYHRAFHCFIDVKQEAGRIDEVIAPLRRQIHASPLDEASWLDLMRALSRTGRPSEALEAYAEIRTVLIEELGVEPSEPLRDFQTDLLRGLHPPQTSQRRPPASPELPATAPQSTADRSGLVGRGEVLNAVHQHVRRHRSQERSLNVLCLHGSPGVGSSAVLSAAVGLVGPSFAGGVLSARCRVTAHKAVSPRAILGQILSGIGIYSPGLPDDLSERQAMLLSLLSPDTLVVLDDVMSAEQVLVVSSAMPSGLLLISSQSQLREVPGLWRVRVPLLSGELGADLLGETLDARRVSRQRGDAVRIARACGGLPLALTIAGARLAATPWQPLAVLAERLENASDVVGEFTIGDLALSTRLSASVEQAGPEAASLFVLLGRLPRQVVTAVEIAPLCGIDEADAQRLLERLAAFNLVESAGATEGYQLGQLFHRYSGTLGET